MKLAGLLMFINDIHSLGLPTTQGMYLTDGWYWNQSPESRAWSRRFFDKMKRMPSMLQAGDYSAVSQYLTAVKAAGTDDADAVMAQLKKQKINDMFAKGRLHSCRRADDPRDVFDAGQDPCRVKGAVGLLQGGADDSGRPGVSVAR